MRTLQLLSVVLGLVIVAACNRADANREAREASAEIRTAAAAAGERLADGWLTTKVQAQFFADDDIKGRYINVTSRDGVVTLKGHVESEQVRQQVLQIAKNTDGVRQISDQLLVGQPASGFETPETGSVATSGDNDWLAPGTTTAAVDDRIETAIQAKYFLDSSIKGRDITVEATNGVVTLRGRVGSDSERAQALILARMSEGVQRVEDGLTVDASLAPSTPTGTSGTGTSAGAPGVPAATAEAPATPAGASSLDTRAETHIKEQLSADARLKGSQLEVTVKDGVVLLQGTVPDQASKQQALTMARQVEGVVQVVDRLSVVRK